MNPNPPLCCLCQYEASSDFDLESHIDNIHADIFCFNALNVVVDNDNDSTSLLQDVVVVDKNYLMAFQDVDNGVSTSIVENVVIQDLDDAVQQDSTVVNFGGSVPEDSIEKNLEEMFSEESHFKKEQKVLTHRVAKKPTKRGRRSTASVTPKSETTSETIEVKLEFNNPPERRKNKSSVSSGTLSEEISMGRKRRSVSTMESQHCNGKKAKEDENEKPVIQASSFIEALGKFFMIFYTESK